MNIKPAFSFSIDMKLSEKGVAVGKYDGINASLTAITQANKVRKIQIKSNTYVIFNDCLLYRTIFCFNFETFP
jgi:hypothetical protein